MAGAVENDAAIVAVASPQAGVCTRSQLVDSGLPPDVVDNRLRVGLLRAVCRGVYVVDALACAATPLHLAVHAAPGSVLSHLTAAILHRLAVDRSAGFRLVHAWVPASIRRRIDGLNLRRTRNLPGGVDVVHVGGLPVTSVERTIVDLAADLGPARIRHVIQTAMRDEVVDGPDLLVCFESTARQGVAGSTMMRKVLRQLFDDEPVAASVLEQAVNRLLSAHGISGIEQQVQPPWYDGIEGVVDFAHPELGIVLEADGRRWHRRDQEMALDRRRDRLAAGHGWVTIRVMWEEVTGRPSAIADDLVSVMHARQGRAA